VKLRFPDIATKWLLLLVAVELALIAALAYLFVAISSDPRFTVENYKRIKHGMSRDEVVAILGRPSLDKGPAYNSPADLPPDYVQFSWITEHAQVGVIFDPSGKVAWANLWVDPHPPIDPKPVDRLKEVWKQLSR
jgi:hypothetical protein